MRPGTTHPRPLHRVLRQLDGTARRKRWPARLCGEDGYALFKDASRTRVLAEVTTVRYWKTGNVWDNPGVMVCVLAYRPPQESAYVCRAHPSIASAARDMQQIVKDYRLGRLDERPEREHPG